MPIDEVAEDKIADEHSGEQDELEYQEHQQRGSVLDEVVARTVDGIPYYYAELPHQHVLHRLHAQVVLPQSVVLPEEVDEDVDDGRDDKEHTDEGTANQENSRYAHIYIYHISQQWEELAAHPPQQVLIPLCLLVFAED